MVKYLFCTLLKQCVPSLTRRWQCSSTYQFAVPCLKASRHVAGFPGRPVYIGFVLFYAYAGLVSAFLFVICFSDIFTCMYSVISLPCLVWRHPSTLGGWPLEPCMQIVCCVMVKRRKSDFSYSLEVLYKRLNITLAHSCIGVRKNMQSLEINLHRLIYIVKNVLYLCLGQWTSRRSWICNITAAVNCLIIACLLSKHISHIR